MIILTKLNDMKFCYQYHNKICDILGFSKSKHGKFLQVWTKKPFKCSLCEVYSPIVIDSPIGAEIRLSSIANHTCIRQFVIVMISV